MKSDKLLESTQKSLQNRLNEAKRINDFTVKKLIQISNLTDKEIDKANDYYKAYNNFKQIALDFIDVPYDVAKLAEDGMNRCYDLL